MNKLNIQNISGKVLLCIFIVVVFFPLIGTFFSRNADTSINEKRKLSPMPQFELSSDSLREFPKQFEAFYNDHFGFRNLFIKLYHLVMINGFQASPVPKIILGKDKYLFYHYKPEKIFEDLQGDNPFTNEELKTWKRILEKKNDWLNRQGIKYLLVIAPNKHTIYPEYIPEKYIPRKGKTRLDQFIRFFSKHSNINILDLREPLLAAKRKSSVYYKSDTHWNDKGAHIAYQEILKKLDHMFPENSFNQGISIHSENGIYKDGDLSLMLGHPQKFQEKTEFLTVKSPCAKTKPFILNTVPVKESITTTCKKTKLKAAIFRDSFFTPVLPFLAEHFNKADYIWNSFNHIILKELIHKSKPDIVIEEKAERLLAFLPLYHEEKIHEDSPAIHEHEKTVFNQKRTTCFLISSESGFDSLHEGNDLTFENTRQGLALKSIGRDPFFFLPEFDFKKHRGLVIKIILSSPMYNDLQVYYATEKFPQYTETQSIHRTIQKGMNEIYITLPDVKLNHQMCLRMDIGGVAGEYILHYIEIRQ